MNAKCRTTMEDAHVVEDEYGGVATDGFFGVYDGHGGRGVVEFVAKYLADNFQKELAFDESRSMEDRQTCAYLVTDIMSRKAGLMSSGCTAITCFLTQNEEGNPHIYCANVGDARIVVAAEDGTAIRMTYDHKASDESENKRITEAGGFVLRNRVLGMLAVSRSFGDHGLKQFVSARPYMKDMCIKNSQFMILACDGLWDVISDQKAIDIVKNTFLNKPQESLVAKALVDAALEAGSSDNITVMVVFFND
eukprot:GSMAST32.ASY1.ANO1.1996.1 assembled CDS